MAGWNRQHVAKRDALNSAHTIAVQKTAKVVAHIQPQPTRGRIERLRVKRASIFGPILWFFELMRGIGCSIEEAVEVRNEVLHRIDALICALWNVQGPTPAGAVKLELVQTNEHAVPVKLEKAA